MVTKRFRVVWTKQAEQHLREIYEHISLDSSQNAFKVVSEIVESMEKTLENPEVYPVDKYKHRVSYRYSDNTIRVLRVRHTKMRPKYY